MDFYTIKEVPQKNGIIEIFPDFKVTRSSDLMVRGKAFYAVWDEERGLWSTDEYDVQRLVDADVWRYRNSKEGGVYSVKLMSDFSSGVWRQFRNYTTLVSDHFTQLDQELTFSNTEVKKQDFVSKRLPYPLVSGDISAYDELIGTLYSPEERAKLEWAIGAVIAGDAKSIQKFLVLYGAAGKGKSTMLNIIMKLTEGYHTTFEAKALTTSSNQFAMEMFGNNPLVAIQHDGDLSRIEDNTRLNSIVAHEDMLINAKFKAPYTASVMAFLFMGTNKPVKITDAKSGIIRRLIDVQPSGQMLSFKRYQAIMSQIDFELGAIAHYCLGVYREMGKDYYGKYQPTEMMLQTDVFYNFIESYFDVFKEQDGVQLAQAYKMYKEFADDSNLEFKLPLHKFREELKNYFGGYMDRGFIDGIRVRSYYTDFQRDKFRPQIEDTASFSLVMDETASIFDQMFSDRPAQYEKENGSPTDFWENVKTTLSDIDTTQTHYVKVPVNHIVIDFDLVDDDGNKSMEKNLEAASKWPATYAEFSKSGGGVHLHYNYTEDPTQLGRTFDDHIEIKVYEGGAALRRRLSHCNNIPVATLNSGLPLKEKKKMLTGDTIQSERSLRNLIMRNLRKEIHPGTKPSVDFIHKILSESYEQGLIYDVTDLQPAIMSFAANSSNQAAAALKLVAQMKFKSAVPSDGDPDSAVSLKDDRLVFFDVEVFPNVLMINWKFRGSPTIVRMINPSPEQVEELFKLKLVGYNCRRYDNHILYARSMGYSIEQVYKKSQQMITQGVGYFAEAYNLSYVDIYDFASKKQSLKKWQVELGLKHQELGEPWDEPLDESKWNKASEYCDNDVISTEAVFENRHGDFVARQILAELSGLPVNSSTQQHTARIIFGRDRNPQEKFVYTDLSKEFPGYDFDLKRPRGQWSMFHEEAVGEGGYVYAEPGIYEDVAVLDIQSMHPTSLVELEHFGPYTERFNDLLKARVAIKHGDYATAREMFEGKLKPYLEDESTAEDLSYALKIAINIVYGLTSASFTNPFKDPNNIDNIVAKRGALFMVLLKQFVQDKGYSAVHIKTDSIKVPNANSEIIEAIMEFGLEYGYIFEHEATYAKMALVNDAVFIAKTKDGRKPAYWTATGAQFQHPYVFKTLFSHEDVVFRDFCESKQVTGAMYLDYSAGDDIEEAPPRKARAKKVPEMVESNDELEVPMYLALAEEEKDVIEGLTFIGKVGLFVPVLKGGGKLVRVKENKLYAVGGTKGYRWAEADTFEAGGDRSDIDMSYFMALAEAARTNIERFGSFEEFADD